MKAATSTVAATGGQARPHAGRALFAALVFGALFVLPGCPTPGSSTPPPPGRPGGTTPPEDTGLATAPIRRLTEEEWNHTVRDLFPGLDLGAAVINDGEGGGFEGDVARQTPSDLVVEQLRAAAIDVAAVAAAHPEAILSRLPTADPADQRAVGRELIASFGPRALRRPLEPREVEAYGAFFDTALATHNFNVALQLVLQTFLQAPAFVYRVELGIGSADDEGAVAVAPYEMASRLSYLLWGSMPDDELLTAAAADALHTPAELEEQARRMLDDPRATDAILSFHRQWLDLDKVLDANKDVATYPSWNDTLRTSIRTEADKMIEEVFVNGDAKLRTLLTTRTTRINAPLAALYGVDAPDEEWGLVELPGAQRAGVLTQAAFLASRSHEVNPSPVLRGVYVLGRFLCEAPPPPMAGININPPQAAPGDVPTTNRDRYGQHTFDPVCQNCHVGMDGIGFGLEGYDAIGAYRTTDNGLPVDTSGSLDGTSVGGTFQGGPGLAALLGDSDIVSECSARHWLDYAHGRAQTRADADQVDETVVAFQNADGDVRELLVAIVTSEGFRTRPAGEVTP